VHAIKVTEDYIGLSINIEISSCSKSVGCMLTIGSWKSTVVCGIYWSSSHSTFSKMSLLQGVVICRPSKIHRLKRSKLFFHEKRWCLIRNGTGSAASLWTERPEFECRLRTWIKHKEICLHLFVSKSSNPGNALVNLIFLFACRWCQWIILCHEIRVIHWLHGYYCK